MLLHINADRADFPDAGEGMCCHGAAMFGPGRCTCWRPEYDREQEPIRSGRQMRQRSVKCDDCAFRDGSPERSGDDRLAHSGDGELDELVWSGRGFACHKGMRRIVRWRHPSGATVEAGPGAYDPPTADGVHFKASGNPADLCAGLVEARKLIESE